MIEDEISTDVCITVSQCNIVEKVSLNVVTIC